MKNAKAFGRVLTRVRREQGFPTARSFYMRCGGAKTLKLAYVSYLSLERGESLPNPSRMEGLLRALNIKDRLDRARELVGAHLACLGYSKELLELFSTSPKSASADLVSLKLSEMAARQALQHRSIQLTGC